MLFSETIPFNRPNPGLHVKVIKLPPAYGNVLVFHCCYMLEHFYKKHFGFSFEPAI